MAVSGQIIVTPEELSAQAEQVRAATKDLQDSFGRMKNLISDTQNYWKGEAAETHRESYRKNETSIEKIVARYQEHIRDLEQMAGVYREAETAAANMADELPALTI